MQHLFVPYSLAVLAKEKGFNDYFKIGNTTSLYSREGILIPYINYGFMHSGLSDGYISAPLYSQVIDWFRENHAIRITDDIKEGTMSSRLTSSYSFNAIKIEGLYTKSVLTYSQIENKSFPSYYEALDKTIETLLLRIKK